MKKYFIVMVFVALYGFFVSGNIKALADTGSKTLSPSADVWIDSANPNNNHPNGDLRIYYNNAAWQSASALIKFDISSIPTGATITAATLQLYQHTCSGYNDPFIFVRRITGSWLESTATWHMMENHSTTAGQVSTDDICSLENILEFNVKDIVQAWINGSSNYGFRIDPDTDVHASSFDQTLFSRDESIDHSYLVVNYSYTPPSSGQPDSGATGNPSNGGTTGTGGTTSSGTSSSTSTSSPSGSSSTGQTTNGSSGATTATDGANPDSSSVSVDSSDDTTANQNQSATKIDMANHTLTIFGHTWPWWQIGLAIWLIMMVLTLLALGTYYTFKKPKNIDQK